MVSNAPIPYSSFPSSILSGLYMLLYYYYTNSKYSKLLSKEIDCLFDIYKKTYKVRVTDEKSLKYTIGNVKNFKEKSLNKEKIFKSQLPLENNNQSKKEKEYAEWMFADDDYIDNEGAFSSPIFDYN